MACSSVLCPWWSFYSFVHLWQSQSAAAEGGGTDGLCSSAAAVARFNSHLLMAFARENIECVQQLFLLHLLLIYSSCAVITIIAMHLRVSSLCQCQAVHSSCTRNYATQPLLLLLIIIILFHSTQSSPPLSTPRYLNARVPHNL